MALLKADEDLMPGEWDDDEDEDEDEEDEDDEDLSSLELLLLLWWWWLFEDDDDDDEEEDEEDGEMGSDAFASRLPKPTTLELFELLYAAAIAA